MFKVLTTALFALAIGATTANAASMVESAQKLQAAKDALSKMPKAEQAAVIHEARERAAAREKANAEKSMVGAALKLQQAKDQLSKLTKAEQAAVIHEARERAKNNNKHNKS